MAKLQMIGGKCGCVTCKDGVLAMYQPRSFWTSKTGKTGHSYGRKKPGGRKQRH